ncbi:MAG: lamin tail domain-containing protein [Myxococcales bacterium]|nr:lamin tail domain-containing protein [Myxococcales bacterium]
MTPNRPRHARSNHPLAAGVACLLTLPLGCEPSLEVPQPSDESGAEIRVHGAPVEGGIAAVARFEVPGGDPTALRVFTGSLSEYHERRIRERDLPESLTEREVPALTWSGFSDSEVAFVGPTQGLEGGQRYSVAALGSGLLLEVDVALEQPDFASRAWPPAGMGGGVAVFCPGKSVERRLVMLDGCPRWAIVTAGIGDSELLADECFSLAPIDSSEESCLAPLAVDDLWLPATLLTSDSGSAEPAIDCEADELSIGRGCLRSADSYVVVRKPLDELWALRLGADVYGPEAADSFVIRGLTSDRRYDYSLVAVDLAGKVARFQDTLRTTRPAAQVVLNEVLANPNGPEPAQEWIEVVNAGTRVAQLEGMVLQDGAGEATLPRAELAPGEYALLVTPEYDRDYPFDLSPSKEVRLIVLEQLGRSGISNAGEPLILRAADGKLLSSIPPLKQDRAGYSVARRTPELSDVLTSFQIHGAPGASPGGANYFDPED